MGSENDMSLSETSSPPGSTTPVAPPTTLARTMGLGALIIYGVGDMLGAGIYGLIGKTAGVMGNAVWLAFLVSMLAAMLTGLSYASLGSRYPRAAGAAYITHRAFGFSFLTYVLGLCVVASGLTSFAAGSRAFAGYFLGVIGAASSWTLLVVVVYILALTAINFRGMRESTALNAVCTLIEVGGLFVVIAVGLRYWGSVDYFVTPVRTESGASGSPTFPLVLQGAVLTFYAFVGFEDMINVSEEVKNPRRNFPIAVVVAVSIATLVYLAVGITAVSVLPFAELAASGQPLVDVVKRAAPWFPSVAFSVISLFAIMNTGLMNYIMGSRVIYGMARQGFVPRVLGRVHATRRTPHLAILALMVIVLTLALSGDLGQLASATSTLLLGVFMVVNAALLVLQRRKAEPKGAFEVPAFVPAGGIIVCGVMLYHAQPRALQIAGILLAGIAVLYAIIRPKGVLADPEENPTPESST
jgi:basic amino acid/polyamine antiporter, APA family